MSATLTVGKGQRTRIYIHVAKTLVKIYKTFQLKKKEKRIRKPHSAVPCTYLPSLSDGGIRLRLESEIWDRGLGCGFWSLTLGVQFPST